VIARYLAIAAVGGMLFVGATAAADWLLGPLVAVLGSSWFPVVESRWSILIPLGVENAAVLAFFGAAGVSMRRLGIAGRPALCVLINPVSALSAAAVYYFTIIENAPGPPLSHWIGRDVAPSLWAFVILITGVFPVTAYLSATWGARGRRR
jgi:hypothetical protein